MEGGREELRVLIHGASGYTGRMIAEAAVRRGWRPVLAGRARSRIEPLATALGCEGRVLTLRDADALAAGLRDVGVVANAASPFLETAPPLMEACLRTGTHYLDVGGDLRVFELAHAWSRSAQASGVMLMPGTGFIVAVTDCLAAHVARRLPLARVLDLGVSRPTIWSRGSMQTLMDLWSEQVVVRRNGEPHVVALGEISRFFDYGFGDRFSTAMAWPDSMTAHQSTGIPDVTVYGEVDAADRILVSATRLFGRYVDAPAWRTFMKRQWSLLPDGPDDGSRASHRRVVVAEARDAAGACVRARLRTPDPYTMTTDVALAVLDGIRAGRAMPGYQTPARVFGPELVVAMERVELEDLAREEGAVAPQSAPGYAIDSGAPPRSASS